VKKYKKPLLIGVITARAAESEQKQQLCGIISSAKKLGINIAVLSNIYNSSEYFANVEIENKIYDLISSEKFDGFILTAESILNPELQQQIYRLLVSRPDTHITVTGAEIDGFDCITDDVMKDTEELVSHLIKVHGFSDIDFLTGFDYMETSLERVEGYRNALQKHGIAFDKKKVIFGNFWNNSGEELAEEYISGKRKLPQAVACANDYMAYGLCDGLLKGGINVPKDVAVIGYEYTGGRYAHAPVLTTYMRNREAIGKKALITLYNKITRENIPLPSVNGMIIKGNSCPCGTDMNIFCTELSVFRREQEYSRMNLVGNFEQQLTTCRSLNDYISTLREFVYLIRDIKGIYLCLYDDWSSKEQHHSSDLMICCSVMSPDGKNQDIKLYRKNELFPESVMNNNSLILYFCPIFFAGREFGYFILQYSEADSYDIIFRDWLKIASNALEYLRLKNDMQTLLECNNLSQYHDSVTGLLNEKGLENETEFEIMSAPHDATVKIILMTNCTYLKQFSIDNKKDEISSSMSIADILFSAVKNHGNCSKLSENMYAVTTTESDTDIKALADKLEVMLIQENLSGNNKNGLPVLCFREFPKENFSFSEVISDMKNQINKKLNFHEKLKNSAEYSKYTDLRLEIWKNPQKEYSPEKICRKIGYSETYFRSRYKEIFGISFRQDIIKSRICLAKYLLLTTSLSLAVIAEKCGYEDEKYFFRRFRNETGLTPNKYRLSR